MCEAAEEIQDFFGKRENREGKTIYYFFRADEGDHTGIVWVKKWSWDLPSKIDKNAKTVWLPSQDHLQDICKGQTIFDVFDDFHSFLFAISTTSGGRGIMITKRCAQFTTAEQLWLAFLMHSTLQKVWNGEKWEKFSLSYRYKVP